MKIMIIMVMITEYDNDYDNNGDDHNSVMMIMIIMGMKIYCYSGYNNKAEVDNNGWW